MSEKVNYLQSGQVDYRKSSCYLSWNDNLLGSKAQMSPGLSNLKTDKFGGDNRNITSHDTDAAPIEIKLSNCNKTKVYHQKRYVAWIFDKSIVNASSRHTHYNKFHQWIVV
jgi:hypothetical protein